MSGQIEKYIHKWNKIWKNADTGFPCIPYLCSSDEHREPRLLHILWVGYKPDQGLIAGIGDWPQSSTPPTVPNEWEPWQDKILGRLNGRIKLLPVNSSAHNQEQTKQIIDVERSQNFKLRADFFSQFPPHVCSALQNSVYPRAKAIRDRYILGNKNIILATPETLDLSLASILLGTDPSPGFSSEEASLRRSQFIQVHPVWGVHLLIDNLSSLSSIDRGDPSIPLLQRKLKINENLVRMFMNINNDQGTRLSKLLASKNFENIFGEIDPQWHPAIQEMDDDTIVFFKSLLGIFKSERTASLENLKYLGQSINFNGGIQKYNGLGALTEHFEDMVDSLWRELLLPAKIVAENRSFHENHLYNVAESALICLGVDRLLQNLDRHLTGDIHDALIGRRTRNLGDWPALAEPTRAPNGLELRFLLNQKELDWEGNQMQHCVASYGMNCRKKDSASVSVGSWHGDVWHPSSTAEIIRKNSKEVKYEVRQHFGRRNGAAPLPNNAALAWWLKSVEKGEIPVYQEALRFRAREYSRMNLEDEMVTRLGEGWNTPEGCAYRWDRWRRIIGVRHKSCTDWLISLPQVFYSSPINVRVAEAVADMEGLYNIELQIRELESSETKEAENAADENAPNPILNR